MTPFNKVLDKYRRLSFSERDKGDKFERLMQAYLLTDRKYADRFKNVWLWNEFHGRNDMGGGDTGIDLVARTIEGDYWAIQCKCFQEDATIDKPAVDSFLSTSSREFKNEELQTARFAHRLWISTTNKWGPNATEAIKNQNPQVTRINLHDLQQAPVDWDKLEKGVHGEASRTPKKTLRPHQKEALEKTHEHFKTSDRGKLIMACGTGKTFNSLRIAEKETDGKGLILFLVPSIALLGQTLREWFSDAKEPINAICICSDPDVSKKKSKNDDSDSMSVVDLALPASTNTKEIVRQFKSFKAAGNGGMTVVFSTYQSIKVIAEAQKELMNNGAGAFDLIICDEAHRTTGVKLAEDEDTSAFMKVHDNNFLKAKKRLYMTATPRLYSDDSKSKAAQADAVLCSMDDVKLYGEEIYRIGFGEAVEKDLLSDYKVLILTLNEADVPPAVQKMITGQKNEIDTTDTAKLIGCINALSKQILGDEGILKSSDPEPMRRAVAFCQSINVSRMHTGAFNTTKEAYFNSLPTEKREQMVSVNSRHIDGTMTAPQRDELLGWLKEESDDHECRVLTNVRCLSEGVDVPSLDAVMFLSARNSQVDVVQSVGRVMRKSPGKKYGYIIIPVVVPSNVEADKALDKNENYKVVWTVLNALRAHDDRFNATINKIELNKSRPHQIIIGRPDHFSDRVSEGNVSRSAIAEAQRQLVMQFQELQGVVFARMVQKVGDRRYWEQWAQNVAQIAERQVERIQRLVKDDAKHQKAFANFLKGLQKNINPSITEHEAIEMLSQHIITRPVFEALFENYSFVKHNPISVSMQKMLDLLEEKGVDKDTETLQKFYDSVRTRAAGIDNAEGKQRIIIELYDKFFKTAFPKMVEKLGIVYTPVEVVDFIIHSVNDVLKKEFGRSIGDENVHILDPFTGTGTFMTRLLQSGLISKKQLPHKYEHELHANEIVLLAYYIAAVNIENAYHDAMQQTEYQAFDGICLTDTFQLGETEEGEKLFSEMFPQNSERVARQKKAPLRVIMGNPPYSKGQKSANDNAQNQDYPILDEKISNTYAIGTDATNKNALYNPYLKAFRWSSDRLDKAGGIVCFVTDGGWLDNSSMSGFRKNIEKEFSSIYVFNLRGDQRTSGELSRKEGGKIFGSGSRSPISITLLVKNPEVKTGKASIHYHDIGDYLDREEKLKIICGFKTFENPALPLKQLQSNGHGDWLNHRNDLFETFIPIGAEDKFDSKSKSYFLTHSLGIASARDPWVYNFSKEAVEANMNRTIGFYNEQAIEFSKAKAKNSTLLFDDFASNDSEKISWNDSLRNLCARNTRLEFRKSEMRKGLYRPFCKSHIYFDRSFIQRPYQQPKLFPNDNSQNLVICVSGLGGSKENSVTIADKITDLNLLDAGTQCFPLYYYEEQKLNSPGLFDTAGKNQYVRRDGVSDFILDQAQKAYGKTVGKEDMFYYVYGFLHSPTYRTAFANDLKKMLPRLPLVEEPRQFWAFSKAGRQLAELHLNYENYNKPTGAILLFSPDYEVRWASLVNEPMADGTYAVHSEKKLSEEELKAAREYFRVEKMRFPSKGEKGTILYNSKITIENIPAEAYEYVVNGKSAIEWIMERYQITTHKESGIRNDPNDWAPENPAYIFNLLRSIIGVSLETVKIVGGLPEVKWG